MDSDGPSTVVMTVSAGAWRETIGDIEPLARSVVKAALNEGTALPWVRDGEISLLLTDDREIRSLNAAYRGRDRATNVLSFPALDLHEGKALGPRPPGAVLLGDVVIGFERLTAEALDQQKAPVDHFAHLLVHGTLHLLGYDHADDAQADGMESLEASVLKALGFAAPYAPQEGGGMDGVRDMSAAS